jgi:hypothetical protein
LFLISKDGTSPASPSSSKSLLQLLLLQLLLLQLLLLQLPLLQLVLAVLVRAVTTPKINYCIF